MITKARKLATQFVKRVFIRSLETVGYQVIYRARHEREFFSPHPPTFPHWAALAMLDRRWESDVRFIQIGGFDGVNWDEVCHHARQCGWRGVIAEPQRAAFEKLSAHYEHNSLVRCLRVAVTDHDGIATLYRPLTHGSASPLASLDATHSRKFPDAAGDLISEQVPCWTPRSLLKESELESVQLLVIDTEGHDAVILNHWPWELSVPDVIIFESLHLSEGVLLGCLADLRSRGYVAFGGGWDVVAVQSGLLQVYNLEPKP